MHRLNQKVLPVIENNKIEGIVSLSDIVRAAMKSEENHQRCRKKDVRK